MILEKKIVCPPFNMHFLRSFIDTAFFCALFSFSFDGVRENPRTNSSITDQSSRERNLAYKLIVARTISYLLAPRGNHEARSI